MEGLQSAFRALSVEEVDTHPVKRKRESEKDAGESIADEGADQGHDPTNDPTFEGAPSASGLHASPSPITTTLPTPNPAAATSTPITDPPMAEGTGFTGMPTYPAYGVNPPTTAFPEATTTSEPVTSSSAPRWYAADYHHPLPATGAYVDVPGYATLSWLRRGPESCGSRSRGSGRSSNRSLTRSEINEVLEGATSKIVGDLSQEIRDKLEPLIPPQASPTTVGMSPHRVQADLLVAGLTNTLGSLRSRPMPTPAVIPRSPFVPRTTQPPYSNVGNSTRAELDRLGLTALRAMVDVQPYGSSDLGGDPSDDEKAEVDDFCFALGGRRPGGPREPKWEEHFLSVFFFFDASIFVMHRQILACPVKPQDRQAVSPGAVQLSQLKIPTRPDAQKVPLEFVCGQKHARH